MKRKIWNVMLVALMIIAIICLAFGVAAFASVQKAGADGKSAYATWLENGNEGTEDDFLNWLKGEKGESGTDGNDGINGNDGTNGNDGESAFDIWKEKYGDDSSTEEDFFEWLKGDRGENGADGKDGQDGKDGADGKDGQDGKDGTDGKSAFDIWKEVYDKPDATEEEFLNWLKGEKGENGTDGKDGQDGQAGADGKDGQDGKDGKDGADGKDGQDGQDGENGKSAFEIWKEVYDKPDATEEDFFEWLKGEKGESGDKGEQGLQGETGRGILRTEIVGTNWIIYFTDGTTEIHDLKELLELLGGGTSERDMFQYTIVDENSYSVALKEEYKGTTEHVVIPKTYNGKPVTGITDNGFKDCVFLTDIEFTENITSIGAYAFSGCDSLQISELPNNLTILGEYAFYNCKLLASEIVIPSGVATISTYCFYGCSSLTTLTIPANVTRIESYAFVKTGLSEVIDEGNPSWKIHTSTMYFKDSAGMEQSSYGTGAAAPYIPLLSFSSSAKAVQYLLGTNVNFTIPNNSNTWYVKSQEATFIRQ